jgi:hypothetical protein
VTLSLLNRLGQRARIMWHTPTTTRTAAGIVAGFCGGIIGSYHASSLHTLVLAACIGAFAGLVTSLVLHRIVLGRQRELPVPVQPISERRVLEVLELLPSRLATMLDQEEHQHRVA